MKKLVILIILATFIILPVTAMAATPAPVKPGEIKVTWKTPTISITASGEILSKEGDWLTDTAIVNQVSQNLKLNFNKSSAGEVEDFLEKFSKMSYEDRLFLYSLMAPVNITFGLFFAGESLERYQWIVGVTIAILGVYCLIRAVMMGLNLIRARRNA